MLNVRDRDIVGFVDEARQAIKPIEAKLAGTGMTIEWSGEFEHQVRARQTMAVIFPMVVIIILFLLYVTFNDLLDTLLVFLAVIGALSGSVMFQALFGFTREDLKLVIAPMARDGKEPVWSMGDDTPLSALARPSSIGGDAPFPADCRGRWDVPLRPEASVQRPPHP